MHKIRPPFNTNFLAQTAAYASLGDKEWLKRTRKNNKEGKKFLYPNFKDMGIPFIHTEANFILFFLGKKNREAVNNLRREGVIIRNTESFNLQGYSRVTVGTPEENRFFIKKLKKVLWRIGKREL